MRLLKLLVWIMYPVFFVALFASMLTTKTYMNISEGLYESHDNTGWRRDGTVYEYDYTYVSHKIIDYLNYQHDDLSFGAFETESDPVMRDIEIRHMEDVRDVYTNVRLAGVFSFLGVIFLSGFMYFKSKKTLYETYKNLFILPLLFVMVVGSWFAVNFSAAFTIFHEIFFDNDDWILLSGDVLIRILPQNFWLVSGVIILGLLLIANIIPYIITKKLGKPNLHESSRRFL